MEKGTELREEAVGSQLAGRTALITGGTSGIGRATALGFTAAGARVIITGRDAARGNAVVDQIQASGGDAAFIQASLDTVAACEIVVADAVAHLGRLDVLVTAAGTFPLGPSLDVTEQVWDSTLDINLKGVFFCGQAALRQMVAQQHGRIILFSSIASVIGFAGAAVYSASKGAILSLGKAWAVEFAPHGILVNVISPGNVETPMNDHLMADPDYKALMLANTPVGRNGTVEDIVPAVILLASEDGRYFCGANLIIDGGWVAR